MAIQIRDEAGLLAPGDLSALQAASARWPFEVHLLTSTSSPNKAAFEARVSAAVDNPNVVAIGLDPTHHNTIVHFGKATGVPASQWSAIYSAGNHDFKGSHWVEGITKIADRTANAKSQAETRTLQPDRPGATSDNTGMWIFGGIIGVALVVGLYYWWKAKKQSEERQRLLDLEADEAAERAARNREEASWHEKYKTKEVARESSPAPAPRSSYTAPRPVYVAPAPAPAPSTVVVNQSSHGGGGSNDLLTGYMIGRLDSPRIVEREVEAERPRHRHASSYSSDDSGGGSSSWGSSNSVSDSGGGSSSWSNSSDSGGGSSSWSSDSGSSSTSCGSSSSCSSSDSGGGSSDW